MPSETLIQPPDAGASTSSDRDGADSLARRFREVRRQTESLCAPLGPEDHLVQSMPDASPAKWHLAHTTWFFETFVLAADVPDNHAYAPQFSYLFNSYYNAVGERIPRARRGLMTRPTTDEVYRYRAAIDAKVLDLLDRGGADRLARVGPTIAIGLNHEQQHQELILTDIKHAFGLNPLKPTYRVTEGEEGEVDHGPGRPSSWTTYPAGLRSIGHEGSGFAFDNEGPRHRVYGESFRLADRPVTNGEYLAFMEAGGYDRPEFWLSDGWQARQAEGWSAPLYWEGREGQWWSLTLGGFRPIRGREPVCHVSYFEADAFARWAGSRLPTEAEWESAAAGRPVVGNFAESGRFHPAPADEHEQGAGPAQLFGDAWEWTQSPYMSYPGFRPVPGALGEYNGKFMCNQMVLRGGSCASPASHLRASYRNFFPAGARWQFSGFRLADEA